MSRQVNLFSLSAPSEQISLEQKMVQLMSEASGQIFRLSIQHPIPLIAQLSREHFRHLFSLQFYRHLFVVIGIRVIFGMIL